MADYKTLKGFKIKNLASDPTVDLGQLWYNTTSDTLKFDSIAAGAWSTGTAINEGRKQGGGAGTSKTSALIFGGMTAYPYVFPAKCEQYNGSAWTELANMTTARSRGASNGTATSAMFAGGNTTPGTGVVAQASTEIWNGTGWTEVNDLNDTNSANTGMGGPATATAAISVSGSPEPQAAAMEIWDGTCWAEGATINTVGAACAGCGTSTAALLIAGSPTPRAKYTEEYNGTSWSEKADSSTARISGDGSGTSTAAIQFGGYDFEQPPPTNTVNVEVWDGTSWTEVANLAQSATNTMAASITSTSTIKIAGYSGPPEIYYTATEEWASGAAGVKTVTTS